MVAICEYDVLHCGSFAFKLVGGQLLAEKRLHWVLGPNWTSPVEYLVVERHLVRRCAIFLELLLGLRCLKLVSAYLHRHGRGFRVVWEIGEVLVCAEHGQRLRPT